MRYTLAAAATLLTAVSAETIAQINGNAFLSPYNGKSVSNVQGLVTAVGPSGFWIRSTTPDNDNRTSESVYVYGSSAAGDRTAGDIVTLSGKVSEYRSSSAYLYLTEITSPSKITLKSSGNTVTPVVLGQNGLNPPTEQYSALDNGDVFAVPNNQSLVSRTNATLQPSSYGLDFWESLSGELVTIQGARSLSKPNQYGDTWVVGNWPTSGENSRGGLTITDKDANPEAIVVGDPLDGTDNPDDTRMGDSLADITGVVTYLYGFYTILPLTKITVTGSRSPTLPPPSTLTSTGTCDGITIGQYNIDNFSKNSSTIDQIADHIVHYLNSPDLLYLQEIQDDDGATDDGVVDANVTLAALRDAISRQSSSRTNYSFVDIDPVNGQDGGQPGGNIRLAYLYNPTTLRLHPGDARPGNSTQATQVLPGPELSYNPGRIDPANAAWKSSRKPLVAHWDVLSPNSTTPIPSFFTINVQLTAKLGGSSLSGDPRPPINGGVAQREAQTNATASFVREILARDADAAIVVAGDWNEFASVAPLAAFARLSGLRELDDVVGTPPAERYSYLYVQNAQELDHAYVSARLAGEGAKVAYEHVHVNTWVGFAEQASDHDPAVGRFDFC